MIIEFATWVFRKLKGGAPSGPVRGRAIFVGQFYYNHWYLSRELRKLGWKATLVNTDDTKANQIYYHGQDVQFDNQTVIGVLSQLAYFVYALFRYKVFVFANTENLGFGRYVPLLLRVFGKNADVRLLRLLGKKIIYMNNGCRDGVLQSTFARWGPVNVCARCPWQSRADVCSDERNRAWGEVRNRLTDYQCLLGGNRADFNAAPTVHEAPWAYSLDGAVWSPDLLVPANYLLPYPPGTIKLYHSVGNFETRIKAGKETIKSTHIYLDVVERLKAAGHPAELIFFFDVPNKQLRFYQAQADIFVEMLTFGWFGASVREAMMLGKPVVCYLRPEWLESMAKELPEYVAELPVVSATPETVYSVLEELITNREKRVEIGRKSREFALKWHGADVAAREFDRVANELIRGR